MRNKNVKPAKRQQNLSETRAQNDCKPDPACESESRDSRRDKKHHRFRLSSQITVRIDQENSSHAEQLDVPVDQAIEDFEQPEPLIDILIGEQLTQD